MQAPNAGPTILSAVRTAVDTVRWTFSDTYTAVADASGFDVPAGGGPDFWTAAPGTNHLDVTYVGTVAVGNPWAVTGVGVAITFTGGGSITPASGLLT